MKFCLFPLCPPPVPSVPPATLPTTPPLPSLQPSQVRHVLYTEPEVVTAGKEVEIFYNPRDTPLNGRQRIFLQGGWNR